MLIYIENSDNINPKEIAPVKVDGEICLNIQTQYNPKVKNEQFPGK